MLRPSVFKRPSGLLVPAPATLRGRIRWQALDERGVPEVPRSPSGLALAPVEGVEQPNLITDLGMDGIAEYDCTGLSASAAGWRRYLKAGTGSTAPAFTDATLVSEVERAASSGSFSSGSNTYSIETGPDVLRIESTVTRIVTMTADRNLTEIGFSALNTTEAYIRELLRDGIGDPITVSMLTGKILRVDHTLTADIAFPVAGTAASINIERYDVANLLESTTAYGVVSGLHGFDSSASALRLMARMWRPDTTDWTAGVGFMRVAGARAIDVATSYARTGVVTTANAEPQAGTYVGLALAAYVAGSHERAKQATIPAGSGNFPWYGFQFGGGDGEGTTATTRYTGFLCVFDDPTTYTKVDTDTMRVGMISTWARA